MKRRDFIAAGAGLVVAAATAGIVEAEHRTTPSKAFWCIDNTANLDSGYYPYIAALEGKLGQRFAGVRINGPITAPYGTEAAQSHAAGRDWLYYNAKPNVVKPDTDTSGTFWKSIAEGRYDSQFLAVWKWATSLGYFTAADPFHYSPQHEQTALAEPPAGAGAGTAADWKAAFQHVHALCVSSGYHISAGGCVALCFVPLLNQLQHDPVYGSGTAPSQVAPYQVSKMDPGAAYYDVCGADIYWTSGSLTAAESFGPLVRWAKTVGKPWITGEFGLSKTKAVGTFLKDLTGIIEACGAGSGAGECYAICGTSRVAGGGDYRYDATTATLAAWKTFAGQPFFGAAV